jgi:CBS domain-containing protein
MEVRAVIAADIMVVVTIAADESVPRAISLMTANDVSALPVINTDGHLVGIISEADLLRRKEIATATYRPSWVETITPATTLAAEYVKSHSKRVGDLMSKDVISVSETASLNDIAALLERNRIKRVPVVRGDQLVGIVSRGNLIQALASAVVTTAIPSDESRSIRDEVLARLKEQSWTDFASHNVIVKDGEVHLWGLVRSEDERKALVALAEGVPGVTKVVDETIQLILSDPGTTDDTDDGRDAQIATAATVAVVAIGTAVVEAALLPAVVLGAAAVWLPKYFPKAGRTLRPLFKAIVRGADKISQKARAVIAEP